MVSNENSQKVLLSLFNELDISDLMYERAEDRYKSLGEFLSRRESKIYRNDPHVYPQGSFRLGTVIKPTSGKDEYDLDISCCLRTGFNTNDNSQVELRDLVLHELKLYREKVGITTPVQTKHRCFRLEYADKISFHIDIVPSMPVPISVVNYFEKQMLESGTQESHARRFAKHSVYITDDRIEAGRWKTSNPEGYALWFDSRVMAGEREIFEKALIGDLPTNQRKKSLQKIVQLLKRHRDVMFKNHPDNKPASIIITTLIALSFTGQKSDHESLFDAVGALQAFAAKGGALLNPVDSNEDFTDKWSMSRYKDLRLRENFSAWVLQLGRDLNLVLNSSDYVLLSEGINKSFSLAIGQDVLRSIIGSSTEGKARMEVHELRKPEAKSWRNK